MSVWQLIIAAMYVGAMVFAGISGRAAPFVWAVVAANFVGSMIYGHDIDAVGIVDSVTLALLIFDASALSLSLAFCFAVCVALDAFGLQLGLQSATTSAIVDVMIIPIAVIIGCLNGDGGNFNRVIHSTAAIRYFNSLSDLPLEKGHHARVNLAASQGVVARKEVDYGQG